MSKLASSENPTLAGSTASAAPTQAFTTRASGGKGLAAMLLAAIVSALVVAADRVVDTFADGHLLLGWISIWALVFACLALFTHAADDVAARWSGLLDAWQARRAQRRSDSCLRALSENDPRIMADIQAATGYAACMEEMAAVPEQKAPRTAIRAWFIRRARSHADARLWTTAQRDPRIMAEVQAAISRANIARQATSQALGRAWLGRRPLGTLSATYPGPRAAFRTTPLAGLPTHWQYLPG